MQEHKRSSQALALQTKPFSSQKPMLTKYQVLSIKYQATVLSTKPKYKIPCDRNLSTEQSKKYQSTMCQVPVECAQELNHQNSSAKNKVPHVDKYLSRVQENLAALAVWGQLYIEYQLQASVYSTKYPVQKYQVLSTTCQVPVKSTGELGGICSVWHLYFE